MNKILRFTALGLCAVALLSSCKKKGTEPIPTPQPGTEQPGQNPGSGNTGGGNNPGTTPGTDTPVSNAAGAKLKLPAGLTTFTLTRLQGENLTIEGVGEAGKNITPFVGVSKTFTIENPEQGITIKGDVARLSFSGGKFASVDFSGLPTLTELTLNKTELLVPLDLSKNTKLTKIIGRATGPDANQSAITLPSSIKHVDLDQATLNQRVPLTAANFPQLELLRLTGSGGLYVTIDMRGSTTLKRVLTYRVSLNSLNLSNAPALIGVYLGATTIGDKTLNMQNLPLLTTVSGSTTDNTFAGLTFHSTANTAEKLNLKTINLSGTGIASFQIQETGDLAGANPAVIESLDLSNCAKLAAASFSNLSALKTLNLTKSGLKGEALTKALGTLPATQGTLKITGLSDSDRQVVTGKGWSISAQ